MYQLTDNDKKLLRVFSNYLNSYGIKIGYIMMSDGSGDDLSYVVENMDTNDWYIHTRFNDSIPEFILKLLKKLFDNSKKEILKFINSIDVEVDFFELKMIVDTSTREISIILDISYIESEFESVGLSSSDKKMAERIFKEIKDNYYDVKEKLVVRYIGSGDSGYVETYENENGDIMPENDIIEDFCIGLINDYFGGWEINEGSSGNIVFDIKGNETQINHDQNYYENIQKTIFEWEF